MRRAPASNRSKSLDVAVQTEVMQTAHVIPEVKIGRSSTGRTHTVVRANADQTGILKASYAFSNAASPDQLTALSEQTGLAIKWISQWFVRQRTKERKTRSGNSAHSGPAKQPVTDPLRSPEEILQIKLEHGDPSGLPPSSPGAPSGSEYAATVSASSSAVSNSIYPAGLAVESSKKKRQTRPRNKKGSTTRVFKNNTRGSVLDEHHVKKELVEASISQAEYTSHTMDKSASSYDVRAGASYTQTTATSTECRPTASAPYHAMLPMIAPAKRSPITTMNNPRREDPRHPRSNLSTNHSDTMYASSLDALPPAAPFPGTTSHGDPQGNQARDGLKAQRSRSQRLYQQGPVLRTQFYNNGPSNYTSSPVRDTGSSGTQSMPYATSSMSSTTVQNHTSVSFGSENFPPPSQHISERPPYAAPYEYPLLAPAFDWENHLPSEPSPFLSTPEHLLSLQNDYQAMQYFLEQSHQNQTIHTPCTARDLVYVNHGAPFQPGYVVEPLPHALDPFHAPVKYLSHVLDDFRDEQGMYVVNDELTARLVGDDVLLRDPFRAAMGLAFLSRLGVEW